MLRLQWRHHHSRAKRREHADVVCRTDRHTARRESVGADVAAVHIRAAATLFATAGSSDAGDSPRGDAGDTRPPTGIRASDGDRNATIADWWNAGIRFVVSAIRATATARQRRSFSAALCAGSLE
jgi:hypothetical protein